MTPVGLTMTMPTSDSWGEWFACRRGGLSVIRAVDGFLRVVEKSLMWSTQKPASTAETDLNSSGCPALHSCGAPESGVRPSGPSFVVMSRPLVWPLFVPVFMFLGFVRLHVYCFSRIIRRPCDTVDMIHWLQSKRRRLRALKRAAIKNMNPVLEEKLGRSLNGTPCVKQVQDSTTPDPERKRKYSDMDQSDASGDSDDEGLVEKLEKYGKEDYDSDTDPDFEPSGEESSEGEDSTASVEDLGEEEVGSEAVKVNGLDEPHAKASSASDAPLVASPSFITVESPEPVSDYGSADGSGSSVTSTPLSPKSKFVKFFKRGNKTRH